MPDVKYPDVTVSLTGSNGNALAIVGAVCNELRRHKIPKDEIDAFKKEALSGDHQHVWDTVFGTVEVE